MGAHTEVAMKEKKPRVEDALHATKAAVEEGIVAGGGVALLRTLPALEKVKLSNPDEQVGVDIVKRAVEEPLRQIANNAGVEGSVIVEKVKADKKNVGYNAETNKIEDLVVAGVIDPTKVVRIALENAASIAGLMLTTEAAICEKPEKKESGPMMPPGGDMY